jgi:hypothetical protein
MRNNACLHFAGMSLAILTGFACLWGGSAQAQGTRPRNNTFHVEFNRVWDMALLDPVKLIEIGPVMDKKKNNLIMLVGGRDTGDFHRHLLVTHWDGGRFVTDTTADFQGTVTDALLVGDFRSNATPPLKTNMPPAKMPPGAKPPQSKPTQAHATPPPAQAANQVVTTEGLYTWTGQTLSRLFSVPVDLRLALMRDKTSDLLVSGSGDQSLAFQASEYEVRPFTSGPPTEGDGYVRFGVGTQEYPGIEKTQITSDIRYAQTYWTNRARWAVGLMRGSPLATPDAPNATTGDRLIIYAPKFSSRSKSFWAMKMDDFEENWRSEPLPGRVLDIRVGDPKNDGKEGILVLTAENNDKNRHLYFYEVTTPLTGR